MIASTLSQIRCPRPTCPENSKLSLKATKSVPIQTLNQQKLSDVWSGHVECGHCKTRYPILAGVLILVEHVSDFLCVHVKGISKLVSDDEIPAEHRDAYLEAKEDYLDQEVEYLEEDLESERVTALYLMNHYLSTRSKDQSWREGVVAVSPVIEKLILDYWDVGPLAKIETWLNDLEAQKNDLSIVELGCGVGGVSRRIGETSSYLGVDSSFASIALARHLNLGVPYDGKIKIPGDLIDGPVSKPIQIEAQARGNVDFILADLSEKPLSSNRFDVSIALNAIDMIDEPVKLPKLQNAVTKPGGFAMQSCPYIWHANVSKRLKAQAPAKAKDSASVVEYLYEKNGFQIEKREAHIPWLFFKHLRQLEVYSVHAFVARKV